ncbi:MAG TPA: ParB/RepB/Spo0J family partition protein [Thermoanaerobaculia bacterium]|nr:ParB/RepB/Spo0J family partition protein [Thermoanaerobaculia bacterium]
MSAAKKKRGLGRGLDALMGDAPAASPGGGVLSLPVGELTPNRHQPRTHFDEAGLDELAESIRAQGVIQPIVATARPGGGYTIVAGERRWRAAQRAGLTEVPAVVREVSGDRELLELALVENLQRADLDPIEEAEAYRALQETFDLSQEAIAGRVGKARTTVTNALRLLRLPPEVIDMLRDGRLTAGQARPLVALPDAERQVELAQRAVVEGLTARDLEELARREAEGPAEEAKKEKPKQDANTVAAEESLTRRLQTKVVIRRRGNRGTLRLHFHSEEELMRLYDLLMARGED